MRVEELKKELAKFPDGKSVGIGVEGSNVYYSIDKITLQPLSGVCLECEDAPEFDDILEMAKACWDANYSYMTKSEKEVLGSFIEDGGKTIPKWKETWG